MAAEMMQSNESGLLDLHRGQPTGVNVPPEI